MCTFLEDCHTRSQEAKHTKYPKFGWTPEITQKTSNMAPAGVPGLSAREKLMHQTVASRLPPLILKLN